jgi:SAM-dependent methyltransferase
MHALERHLERQLETGSDAFFWHRLRWRAVSSYLPEGRPFCLLDVGAGAGILGEYLRRARPLGHYLFVEPVRPLERSLEHRFGSAANVRGAEALAGVDVVTMLDVIEHQADDAGFLAEVVCRLTPGAVVLVTAPALPALWSAWDEILGHHRRYDRRGLRAAFADLPVEWLELSYLFPELVPFAAARKLVRKRVLQEHATLPELPRVVNAALHAVGSASVAHRRHWPAGTSLLAAVRRV